MKSNNLNICPVCGFDKLGEPPYAHDKGSLPIFEICFCCGYQFGYDDTNLGLTFEAYRKKWINDGFSYHLEEDKPEGWDEKMMQKQLRHIEKVNYTPRLPKKLTDK